MGTYHIQFLHQKFQRDTGLEWWEDSSLYSEWLEERESKRSWKAKPMQVPKPEDVVIYQNDLGYTIGTGLAPKEKPAIVKFFIALWEWLVGSTDTPATKTHYERHSFVNRSEQ